MMTYFGVCLVEILNRLISPQEMHKRLGQDKLSVAGYQEREYEEAERVCPEFGKHWDLRSKKVLDVGSGLGGKPLYYSDQGADCVVAIDLRSFSVAATRKLMLLHERSVIYPVLADAAHVPFAKGYFDVIVSINVFEHVDDLSAVLYECKRLLHPGGLIFLYFPPFYSPWGAHVEGWINFPWPHVVFSDRVLIRAIRRIEEMRKLNEDYIPPAQVGWQYLEHLPELNRITARGFKRLIREVGLQVVESHMLPFGHHALRNRGTFAQIALRALRIMADLPVAREFIATKMVFALTKS